MKACIFAIGVSIVLLTLSCAERGGSTPVAVAGPDQNLRSGSIVVLDASGSYDADPDILTYLWSFDAMPSGSSAALSDPLAVNPFFTADVEGVYVLRLVVNDGILDSAPDTVVITAATDNSAPVAVAGVDQNVETSSQVFLDGSESYDADGDALTYSWTFSSLPDGSNAVLSDSEIINPSFIADIDGSYVLTLVVDDGRLSSAMDLITITATSTNAFPVAEAGSNQNVETGSLVRLDGSGSSDANGDLLTYKWSISSLPDGSNAILSDFSAVNPTFTADADGSYVLHLVVNDGSVDSLLDAVTVTAATSNLAPIADAGSDLQVETGSLVTLDGSGSNDANGDLLAYVWSFTSMPIGSLAILTGPDTVTPSFVADADGTYVLSLVVNDGVLNSASDLVSVTAATANSAPVADAGENQNVATGSTVSLDGSRSSDANGDQLTYNWSFTSIPPGSIAVLSDTSAVNPTFVADLDGSYVLALVVDDGLDFSDPSIVTVSAATLNSAPVANAGPDQNVVTGSLVTLDGSGSSDADGDPLFYRWAFSSIAGVQGVTLTGGDTVSPSFTAAVDGSYVLSLVVSDGDLESAPDTVVVTAETVNSAPVASAGEDQGVAVGDSVSLRGNGSTDADGDTLIFSWTFASVPEGSAAVLDRADKMNPTFTPDVEGAYVVRLVVSDGSLDSDPDTLVVTAQ